MIIKVLEYVWQLPQNILGLLVILFSKAQYDDRHNMWSTSKQFGVSLGKYIILNETCSVRDIAHEAGHQRQSLYLGWLYLIVIGLPSATGNLIDRWFHKRWIPTRRLKWYYSLPWEAWADRLGGVVR